MEPEAPPNPGEPYSYRVLAFDDEVHEPVSCRPIVDDKPLTFCRLDGTAIPPAPRRERAPSLADVLPRSRSRSSHRARPGHRRTTSTRAGPSDDDGPAPEPPRRRYVLDRHYCVVALEVVA